MHFSGTLEHLLLIAIFVQPYVLDNDSNTDGDSFTMADLNSVLNPEEILPISHGKKYFDLF